MRASRTEALLFLATLAAVLVAGWALWSESGASHAARRGEGDLLFPALGEAGAEVTGLAVATPSYALALKAVGTGWVATSHAGYPVRTELAADLVADLAALRLIEAKTQRPDWFAFIGVEDPSEGSSSRLVRLGGDGTVLGEAIVGHASASLGADPLGGTFVRRPGERQAWLARGLVELPPTFNAWFEELLDIPGPDITRITISEGGTDLFDAVKRNGAATYSLAAVAPAYRDEGEIIEMPTRRRRRRAVARCASRPGAGW